jgi:transposase
MPAGPRPRRDPTDDWDQLRLLVVSSAQETYELLRPIVLFGQPIPARARETAVPERTLRRKVARFDARGMHSLFDLDALAPPTTGRRLLPPEIRRAVVELKAEYPPFGLREIATICRHRFDRRLSHHTVRAVLASEPLPVRPPRRFPRYHETADPVARRRAVVTLYLDGWSAKAITGYLETSRQTVYEVLRRWDEEGWPGLADRPLGPRHPARKVDLRAMAAIRRLQANPELGEFRVHAALAQQGIHLSPSTCGRILALHRALGAPRPAAAEPHEAQPMPFAAQRRHQYWSVDVRYIEDHQLGTGKPVYAISILENFSRALLASAISPRQDLTAYLIVLRAAVEAHGAPRSSSATAGASSRRRMLRPSTRRSASARSRLTPGRPGRTTSNPISTSCAAWPTTTTPMPRPGASRKPSTTGSSRTTTTSRTTPTVSGPTGGSVPARCSAGCRARGASRPTSTGSSGSARHAASTPAVSSASVTGASTGSAASPANGSPSGSGMRR